MKSRIITAMVLVLSIGGMTMSCEKEQLKPAECNGKTTIEHTKDGGDDDDDPVIRGKVKNKNTLVAIPGAGVETFTYSTGTKVATKVTDSLGDFDEQLPVGIYYFKVTPVGGSTVTTDTVHVNGNMNLTLAI